MPCYLPQRQSLFLAFCDGDRNRSVRQPAGIRSRYEIQKITAAWRTQILVALLEPVGGRLHLRMIPSQAVLTNNILARPFINEQDAGIISGSVPPNHNRAFIRANTPQQGLPGEPSRDAGFGKLLKIGSS